MSGGSTADDGKPTGRLHVVVEPAFRTADSKPMYVITLTARCRASGPKPDDILAVLDLGRKWVVRGFASVTTPEMHEKWRRVR